MAQTPTIFRAEGDSLDYTPDSAVTAGDVVLRGQHVTIARVDIPADTLGATSRTGVYDGPKDDSEFADGDPVYYDPNGDPTDGTANSGCFTVEDSSLYFAGYAVGDAESGDATVRFKLVSFAGENLVAE